MSDPHNDTKQRDRVIAHNESALQAGRSVHLSLWAIAIVAVIAMIAFGWVYLGR